MTEALRSSPVPDLLLAKYESASRQALIEERLFFSLYITISAAIGFVDIKGAITYIAFFLLIVSLVPAFVVRQRLARNRLRHLEEAIVNLDPSMLDYYVKSMSYRYYDIKLVAVAESFSRALLPAVALTLLGVRYFLEAGLP